MKDLRTAAIHLASTLPKGSSERRALLEVLATAVKPPCTFTVKTEKGKRQGFRGKHLVVSLSITGPSEGKYPPTVCKAVDDLIMVTYRKAFQILKKLDVPMDRATKGSVCDNFFGSLLWFEAYPTEDNVRDVEQALGALAAPLEVLMDVTRV